MSFYPPPEGGGGGNSGMPAPFSQKVIAGKLQTLQDTTVIAEQDQYGSWAPVVGAFLICAEPLTIECKR